MTLLDKGQQCKNGIEIIQHVLNENTNNKYDINIWLYGINLGATVFFRANTDIYICNQGDQ